MKLDPYIPSGVLVRDFLELYFDRAKKHSLEYIAKLDVELSFRTKGITSTHIEELALMKICEQDTEEFRKFFIELIIDEEYVIKSYF